VSETNWGQQSNAAPRAGQWTGEAIARFRELYGLREESFIARELKCTVQAVRALADEVYGGPAKQGPWSTEETEQLLTYLGAADMRSLCHVVGRSQQDIENRLVALALERKDGPWSQDETARFKRLYGTRRDEDLAIIFSRSLTDVEGLANKLCIAKDKAFLRRQNKQEGGATRMPRWGSKDLEVLRELYPTHSNLEIARRLERSVKSVVSKAHNLGLRKDPSRLKEMGRENVSLRYNHVHPDGGGDPSSASQA